MLDSKDIPALSTVEPSFVAVLSSGRSLNIAELPKKSLWFAPSQRGGRKGIRLVLSRHYMAYLRKGKSRINVINVEIIECSRQYGRGTWINYIVRLADSQEKCPNETIAIPVEIKWYQLILNE